jgi:hypothetical protein
VSVRGRRLEAEVSYAVGKLDTRVAYRIYDDLLQGTHARTRVAEASLGRSF